MNPIESATTEFMWTADILSTSGPISWIIDDEPILTKADYVWVVLTYQAYWCRSSNQY